MHEPHHRPSQFPSRTFPNDSLHCQAQVRSTSPVCTRTRVRAHGNPMRFAASAFASANAACSAAAFGEAPGVGIVEAVVERFDALHPLALGQVAWVGRLEESRRELDQPLGLDCHHLRTRDEAAGVFRC
eukprot:5394981-Pleurochrysis_carterae.AAC.3